MSCIFSFFFPKPPKPVTLLPGETLDRMAYEEVKAPETSLSKWRERFVEVVTSRPYQVRFASIIVCTTPILTFCLIPGVLGFVYQWPHAYAWIILTATGGVGVVGCVAYLTWAVYGKYSDYRDAHPHKS